MGDDNTNRNGTTRATTTTTDTTNGMNEFMKQQQLTTRATTTTITTTTVAIPPQQNGMLHNKPMGYSMDSNALLADQPWTRTANKPTPMSNPTCNTSKPPALTTMYYS